MEAGAHCALILTLSVFILQDLVFTCVPALTWAVMPADGAVW